MFSFRLFYLPTLIRFRIKMSTFWWVLVYHPHRNSRKRWWKRQYVTFLSAPLVYNPFPKTSALTYLKYKRSIFKKAPLLKSFSKKLPCSSASWSVCPVFTRIIYSILQLHSFYTTRYLYLTKSVGLPVVASLSFRKSTRAKIQITLFSVKKNVW